MSKKEENILDLQNQEKFKINENFESVPYLNNNSDLVQEILNEVELNTANLQTNFISSNDENIVNINFKN